VNGGGTVRQNMAQKYVTDMLSEYLVNIFLFSTLGVINALHGFS
jgi:hypothetical protein